MGHDGARRLVGTGRANTNRASMPDADFARWVQPAEIANVIRFLCSDDARPISGGHVPVYGMA